MSRRQELIIECGETTTMPDGTRLICRLRVGHAGAHLSEQGSAWLHEPLAPPGLQGAPR